MSALVAAEEEPVFPAEDLAAQAEQEFHLAARAGVLSFIVVFGVTKALTNYNRRPLVRPLQIADLAAESGSLTRSLFLVTLNALQHHRYLARSCKMLCAPGMSSVTISARSCTRPGQS